MRAMLIAVVLPIALLMTSTEAQALCTVSTGFGPLPQATFGGTGISNLSVAHAQSGCTATTLGLTATPRYGSPAVTNDGVGTFFASAGYDANAPFTYAQWNFDFYVGGSDAANWFHTLYMDVDPSAATNFIAYDFAGANQDSWNIGMFFYGAGFAGPGDPTVGGQYSYSLVEWTDAAHSRQLAHVDIEVDVAGTTVATPEPASLVLMATGLLGMGITVRRRKVA